MAGDVGPGTGWVRIDPDHWFLVFERDTPHWWLRWVGRFKHVYAIGYVPDACIWVRYNVGLRGTQIQIMPDCQGVWDNLKAASEQAAIVTMRGGVERGWWFRLGFWCAPAMAHLVGVRGVVLRPDALFRKCMARGGVVV